MRQSSLRFCILDTPAHRASRLKLLQQCDASARQAAHDRPYRHAHNFCGLLVAQSVNSYEQQRDPLICRQAIDGPANLIERQTRLHSPHRLVGTQPRGRIAILLPDVSRADLIDPDRLHDAKHPTVKPRALLKLVLACEGTLTRRLDEIVGLDRRACKSASKPT